MTRILVNRYHGTAATMDLAPDGSVSDRQLRAAMRVTCPVEGCPCRRERLDLVAYRGRHQRVTDRLDWLPPGPADAGQRWTLA